MSLTFIRWALVALLTTALLACGGSGERAAPPSGFTVVPGDGQVTVSWVADPTVEYWLFYAPTASINVDNLNAAAGHRTAIKVFSPHVVTGLLNGTTYSFTMNGRTGSGPGGPGTPSVATVPRPAGSTWVAGGSLGGADMRGITFGTASDGLNYYVAAGLGGALSRSRDGIGWSALTPAPALAADLFADLYALGKFMAVGQAGKIFYGTDLTTWTAAMSNTSNNLNALASNGTLVVTVGDGGVIRSSADGITWANVASPTSANLYGVAYSAIGRWIAVGAAGNVVTSTDAVTWVASASGVSRDLRSVAVQPISNVIVVAGATGTLLRSLDGLSWTNQSTSAADLLTLSGSTSQFLALGVGGAALTSPDGLTWTSQNTGSSANLYAVSPALVQYVAVGQGGISLYSR